MTANDALAFYQEELLKDGPMGWDERPDAMRSFLTHTFLNGAGLWEIKGTTCALFQGGSLIGCGAQERRRSPTVPAITTWLRASWFSGPEWIPIEKLLSGEEKIIRGDIIYWCSGSGMEPARVWQAAKNGHVGSAREGDGFSWSTAEGGGARGRCSLIPKKDVLRSWNRHARGVWRPDRMKATVLRAPDTDPAPAPSHPTLRRGSSGVDVRLVQGLVGAAQDGQFGPKTEAAVRAWQGAHGLSADGVVGPKTWAALLQVIQ